jgi:hypothetical protein
VMPVVYRLRGPLDVGALTEAVRNLVRRHESLRTAIVDRDGEPAATVVPAEEAVAALTVDRHDVSGLPVGERLAAARAYAARRTAEPVPPHRAPLLRAALVRLDTDDHVLVLTTHHIAADDQSIGILVRDLAAGYAGPVTAEPDVRFGDYAVWAAGRGRRDDAERYWAERLAGAPPLSALPGDRPRPAVVGYRGAGRPFALGADLSARRRSRCCPPACSR